VEHAEGSIIKIKMNKSRDGLAFDWTEPETSSSEEDSAENHDSSSTQDEESEQEAKA